LLGSIGQRPVRQRFIAFAKDELRERSPRLFEAARALKKKIDGVAAFTALWASREEMEYGLI
jgi:hypothetical protein